MPSPIRIGTHLPALSALREVALSQVAKAGYQETPQAYRELVNRILKTAPATFEVFRPEHVLETAMDAASPGSRSRMVALTPERFLRLAAERPRYEDNEGQIASLRNMLETRTSTPDYYDMRRPDREAYYAEKYPEFEGFGSPTWLELRRKGGTNFINGHEGRHRMEAIGQAYGYDTPLVVRMDLGQSGRPEALRAQSEEPWLVPERYKKYLNDRGEVDSVYLDLAPRPYAQGGLALSAKHR